MVAQALVRMGMGTTDVCFNKPKVVLFSRILFTGRVLAGKVTAVDWAGNSKKLVTVKQDGQIMVLTFLGVHPHCLSIVVSCQIFRFGTQCLELRTLFGNQMTGT